MRFRLSRGSLAWGNVGLGKRIGMNMHLAFVANDNSNNLLTCQSTNGKNWSNNKKVGHESSKTAPTLSYFSSAPRPFVLGFISNNSYNSLLTSYSGNGQDYWSVDSLVKNPSQSQSSKAAPALAVFQNKLWIAFVANDTSNQLLICNSGNGQDWSDNILVKNPSQSQSSKAAPALAVFQNKLWIAFVASDTSNQLLICNSGNGQDWSDNSQVKNPSQSQSSKAAPAQPVFQNKLWIAFVANDTSNQLLICNSGNGQDWSDNSQVKNPNQSQSSKAAPALAVFQNKLWIAFVANGPSNQLLICNSGNGQGSS